MPRSTHVERRGRRVLVTAGGTVLNLTRTSAKALVSLLVGALGERRCALKDCDRAPDEDADGALCGIHREARERAVAHDPQVASARADLARARRRVRGLELILDKAERRAATAWRKKNR